jgi:nicotinic acid phosphoribosyltransferase
MKESFFQDDKGSVSSEEESGFDFSIIRPDGSLFKDDQYIPHALYRVRHVTKKQEESWDFWMNDEVVTSLNAARFSEEEKAYLRSVAGAQFLLQQFKNKEISFKAIKAKLKALL